MEQVRKKKHYTYADYAAWDTDDRYELIDGVPYLMSPAPKRIHQEISGAIARKIGNFLEGKPCKVYAAPFDVRLHGDGDEDDTVVQPDIAVICDRSKLDEKGCNGAPDMVAEILSPSSAKLDTLLKLKKYQEAGVLEYWVVDAERETVMVHLLESGKYMTSVYDIADTIPVQVLPGCRIDLPYKEMIE